jgi:hypothetical protein
MTATEQQDTLKALIKRLRAKADEYDSRDKGHLYCFDCGAEQGQSHALPCMSVDMLAAADALEALSASSGSEEKPLIDPEACAKSKTGRHRWWHSHGGVSCLSCGIPAAVQPKSDDEPWDEELDDVAPIGDDEQLPQRVHDVLVCNTGYGQCGESPERLRLLGTLVEWVKSVAPWECALLRDQPSPSQPAETPRSYQCSVCGLEGHQPGDSECDGPHGGFVDPNCTGPCCKPAETPEERKIGESMGFSGYLQVRPKEGQ